VVDRALALDESFRSEVSRRSRRLSMEESRSQPPAPITVLGKAKAQKKSGIRPAADDSGQLCCHVQRGGQPR